MKKLLLTLAALPMGLYAGQATAQVNANTRGGATVQTRIANLESRFNAGVQAGAFTQSEYATISRQLAELRSLERSYSYNGISESERQALQQRIRQVRDQLRSAGSSTWASRYDWNDREYDGYATSVTYDAYGRPIPQGGVAYDQYGRPINHGGVVYDQYGRVVANRGVTYDQYGRPINNNGVVYDQYGRPVTN
jgi:hypothetical protein